MKKALFLFFIYFIVESNAAVDPRFLISNTLGSEMVLQRSPLSANIFGLTTPLATVTVAFNSQNYQTTAGADGSWLQTLPPTPAGGPYIIGVSSSDGNKAVLQDVLFGDVWLCGGQSNMQFTVASAFNATAEIENANNYPNIRVLSVGQSNYSSVPLNRLTVVDMEWTTASSKSIGAGNWTEFSAVCWFTGRNLYDQYQVPIGLISSNWGGTLIQAWSPPLALLQCNVTTSSTDQEANSVLYNAMIYPFRNQPIKGVLWYQGEQNWDQATLYSCLFPAMIQAWRSSFTYSPQFSFLFVQLAAWVAGSGNYIPDVRAAQLSATSLSSVGFATAADLGDSYSPYGSVHPRYKQEVGVRLAQAVRAVAYGEDVVWEGPLFSSASVSVTGTVATVQVNWKLYGTGSFVIKSATCPENCPTNQCSNWAYYSKGDINIWTEATPSSLKYSGSVVTVQFNLPNSSVPVHGIRYGYAAWPLLTLYSEQDLPAIPFQYLFN